MINQIVVQAIKEKHVLRLDYHGFHRLVEPHAYGNNDLGHDILRCWQIDGGSKSGERQGWKLLLLREVMRLADAGTSFASARPDYKRDDSAMQRIYAQL